MGCLDRDISKSGSNKLKIGKLGIGLCKGRSYKNLGLYNLYLVCVDNLKRLACNMKGEFHRPKST